MFLLFSLSVCIVYCDWSESPIDLIVSVVWIYRDYWAPPIDGTELCLVRYNVHLVL